MRLVIVRHGETAWNRLRKTQGMSDTPLNKKGEVQARLLGEYLCERFSVRAVYASPLQRAMRTAEILASGNGWPVLTDPALREIAFGEWEGLSFADIARRYPKEFEVWKNAPADAMIPGAESMMEVLDRVEGFVGRMRAKYEQLTVACVTHSVPSKLLIASALGLPLTFMHAFRMDNASVSVVDYYSERNVLMMMNDRSHVYREDTRDRK